MTTHVSHWTTARTNHAHDAHAHLHRYAATMKAFAPPARVWPLIATVALTKLAMLSAIVWASSDLAAGTVLAVLDIPLVVTILMTLGWALLASMHVPAVARAAEKAR